MKTSLQLELYLTIYYWCYKQHFLAQVSFPKKDKPLVFNKGSRFLFARVCLERLLTNFFREKKSKFRKVTGSAICDKKALKKYL